MSKIITINGSQYDDFSLLITKIQCLHYLLVLHSENQLSDIIREDCLLAGKENASLILNELIGFYLDALNKKFNSFYNEGAK